MKHNKTAILISSPFQTLCALDALFEYPSKIPDFYTIEDSQNTDKIASLLADYGYRLTIVQPSSNTLMWYVNNFKRKKYDRIIVGDLFAFPLLILISIMAKWKTKVIYVDDGTSTLFINTGLLPNTIFTLKWKIVSGICQMKRIKKVLYTIFPIDKFDSMPVIQHSFRNLFTNINQSVYQQGVYIIGTNTSAIEIEVAKYKKVLKQILDKYLESSPVLYCPHRRDHNQYEEYCKNIGIGIFDTKVSVEYDFIKNNIYPKRIIGFGSTALYTLKRMFPLAEVHNVILERKYNVHFYNYISELYFKEGIKNSTIDQMCD